MRRLIDILLAGVGLVVLSPLLIALYLAVWLDTGAPLFRQQRLGRQQRPFTMIKFRTMREGVESVPTHLADPAAVTPLGAFLRRTKLDELPQLYNVLKGEMSLVGPRPCLPNQTELIAARERLGVFAVRPGITGLAQILGIDMSTPQLLAETEARMLQDFGLTAYFGYLLKTIAGAGRGDRIRRS